MSLDNMLYGYLDVPDTPLESEKTLYCNVCEDVLTEGDYVYNLDDVDYCQNCLDAYILNCRRVL